MNEEKIARINELYHKSKKEGLTDAEKQEQQMLRKEYIAAIKGSVSNQLAHVTVVNPDGSIVDAGKARAGKKGH